MESVPRPVQASLFDAATKVCTKCGQDLPLTDYYVKHKPSGRRFSWCKACHTRTRMARYYELHPAKPISPAPTEGHCSKCGRIRPAAEFKKTGVHRNRLGCWCRGCRNEAKRRYNEANREKLLAASREYYRENSAKIKARIQAINAANPDKYRAIHTDWKRRNKDAVNASTHKRRARLRGNRGSWSDEDWQRLKACYDWRCLRCGKQEMTDGITLCFDHIIPLSMGGLNIISNGQPLCKPCNSTKHTKAIDYRKA